MEREGVELRRLAKHLGTPAVLLRGGFDITQHGADVNRLAVVAAVVFAGLLHTWNFTQRRKIAKRTFVFSTSLPV
jgi:hypothetical protein